MMFCDNKFDLHDIAAMSHACAAGLPGTEHADLAFCVRTLDQLARQVHSVTVSHGREFQKRPAAYHNSLSYFRALCLITVLQRDCGIHYNPARIPAEARFETEDHFLFGVVQTKAGTCANLPMLYAAVGRRLGYPIKLVTAYGKQANHGFARWDDGQGDRFNIEATNKGLNTPPDDYYRTGRYATPPDIEAKGNFLKSMTPREELASFLAMRSLCFYERRNYRRAVEALIWASAASPDNLFYSNTWKIYANEWLDSLQARMPKGFPKVFVHLYGHRFPKSLPRKMETEILGKEGIENVLNDPEMDKNWWRPMRRKEPLQKAPKVAHFGFWPDGTCKLRYEFGTLTPSSYGEDTPAEETPCMTRR